MNPRLGIMLLTYNRIETAKLTVEALARNLVYDGPVRFHVADDGSTDQEQPDKLLGQFNGNARGVGEPRMSWSTTGGNSYGASYNLACQHLHPDCEAVLVLEDDWELTRKLDVTPYVNWAVKQEGVVRMGYIGWTDTLWGEFADAGGKVAGPNYLMLMAGSREKHVYAGHPRIESVAFSRRLGPWPEGIGAGATELEVCGRLASRDRVYWPLDLPMSGGVFAHIGAESMNAVVSGGQHA